MENAREIVPDVAPLTSGKSPPASNSAIRSLPLVHVTIDDLLEESNKECLVCLEGHRIGSLAYKLACGHLFHTPCITKWLQKHCTCPVCRYELRTDDYNYERDRRKRMLQRKMRFRLDELQSKKVCQLREIASSFAVSIAGCIDKTEIIEKLLASGRIELVEAAPPMLIKEAVLKTMSVTELKCLLRQFGLADSGVLEKNELRERLLNSRRVVIDSLLEIQIFEDRVETFEKINSEADSYGNAARNESHSSSTHVGIEEVENREEFCFKEKKGSRATCLKEKSPNLTLYERTLEQSAGTASYTPEIIGCISGYNGRSYSKQTTGGNKLFAHASQQPNEQSYRYDISHIENTTYGHISSSLSDNRIDISALLSNSLGAKDTQIKAVSQSNCTAANKLRNICVKDDK